MLSPEQIVYLGYCTEQDEQQHLEVAYMPNRSMTLRVERLLHRSLKCIKFPEDSRLMRVHRKVYVNLNFVEGYSQSFGLLFCLPQANGMFSVGRSFRKAFKAAFGIY